MIPKSSFRSNSEAGDISPTRNLPSSHQIEDRYKSYSRVEDYIKHMTNIYTTQIINSRTHDEAYLNTTRFRAQTPSDHSKFKVSQFPKAKVNQELLEQQEVLNAFNQPSFESRSRCSSRQRSRNIVLPKRSKTARLEFSYKKEKISLPEKCPECKRNVCDCPKRIQDSFLKKMLRKHSRSLEKSRISLSPKKERKSLMVVTGRTSPAHPVIELKGKNKIWKRKVKKNVDNDISLIVSPVQFESKEKGLKEEKYQIKVKPIYY
jgi:predicted Zn-ribbon and HTH transcriptional regulator